MSEEDLDDFSLEEGQSAVIIGEDGFVTAVLLAKAEDEQYASPGYLSAVGLGLLSKQDPEAFAELHISIAVKALDEELGNVPEAIH